MANVVIEPATNDQCLMGEIEGEITDAKTHAIMLQLRAQLIEQNLTPLIWAQRNALPGEIPCLFLLLSAERGSRIAAKKILAQLRLTGQLGEWPEVVKMLQGMKHQPNVYPVGPTESHPLYLESFPRYLEHQGEFVPAKLTDEPHGTA